MAQQRIVHGAKIDAATPDEVADIVRTYSVHEQITRIRASADLQLVGGVGQQEVYKVPLGYTFAARRIALNLNVSPDGHGNSVALGAGGSFVAYYRSGSFMEYALPEAPNAGAVGIQVPGVQTWGQEEGPFLQNGEVFEVACNLVTQLTAVVFIELEGLLTRPFSNAPTKRPMPDYRQPNRQLRGPAR